MIDEIFIIYYIVIVWSNQHIIEKGTWYNMKRTVQRLLSLLITFSLVFAGTISAAAASPTTGTNALLSSMKGLTGIRTNLTFLEGRAGDTTWFIRMNKINSFKVVEDFPRVWQKATAQFIFWIPMETMMYFTLRRSPSSDEVVVTFTDTYKAGKVVIILTQWPKRYGNLG